jgi:hypothetical protein
VDSADSVRAGTAFEALLLAPMLRPMLPETDAFGEYGLDLLARDIAAHDPRGFAAVFAAEVDKAE